MKEKKRKVGRPKLADSNLKRKSIVMISFAVICLIALVSVAPASSNLANLQGKTTSSCPEGYKGCRNPKNCECRTKKPVSGAVEKCKRDYVAVGGDCYKTAKKSKGCPSGYKACSSRGCECIAISPTDGKTADNSCVNGYVEGSGYCYKTANPVSSCPNGYSKCSSNKCQCKQKTQNSFSSAKKCKDEIKKVDGWDHSLYVNGVCYRTEIISDKCSNGTVKCSSNKCKCKYETKYSDKAKTCRKDYKEVGGKCYHITKKQNSVCPNGYRACSSNKCECVSQQPTAKKAEKCKNGYIEISGNCYKKGTKESEALNTGGLGNNRSTTNTLKVLLIGNSYTFYNGYGQMITKLAAKTGKRLIVVRATHGGWYAPQLASSSGEKLNCVGWASYKNATNNSIYNKSCYLKDVMKESFGVRKDYWDYVILQNNEIDLSKVVDGDNQIYRLFKDNNVEVKNFVINSPHFRANMSDAKEKLKKHEIFASTRSDVSIIRSVNIIEKYGDWKKDLVLNDDRLHMSGKGAYLYALITYAKIYGVNDLARSETDSDFIPLYNNNGTTKAFAPDQYKTKKCKEKPGSCVVTDSDAKKLQSLVRNNCGDVGNCN